MRPLFLLTDGVAGDEVWVALQELPAQATVLFWPSCSPWLAAQVADPSPAWVEFRPDVRP